MRKILVVVDMQNDFTYGALRNEDAIAVIPRIVEKLSKYEGEVIFTRDTHFEDYMDTQEGRKLPVKHCIKGSEGWQLVPPLDEYAKKNNSRIYDKLGFGSLPLANDVAEWNKAEKIDEVELIGVCTDICVIANATLIKAAVPETTVKVDGGCCAGVSRESHDTALAAMRAFQIEC